MRQMVYTTNDLAYIQDIEALNKKINALAEQSHLNDVQTFSIQDQMIDEFATVEEVNNVLSNYVLKVDMPPTADLSEYAKLTNLEEYRKKNDLLSYTEGTIKKNVEFNILRSTPFTIYTVDLGYLEGSHIILKYNDVVYDIDFKIDAENQQGSDKFYDCNLTENTMLRWLVNSSNKSQLVLLDNNSAKIYELVSIVYNAPDEFALKSELNETSSLLDTYARNHQDLANIVAEQYTKCMDLENRISTLETENTTLKAQLVAVKPIYPWTSYYEGFDERVEFINNYHVIRSIYYLYNNPGNITINVNISYIGNYEYLLIILNKDRSLTYIRLNPNNRYAYLNEISGGTLYSGDSNGVFPLEIGATLNATTSSTIMLGFDYIFKKSAE